MWRLLEAGRALEGNFHTIVGDAHFDTTLGAHRRKFRCECAFITGNDFRPNLREYRTAARSFMHQPSCVWIRAWPISASPRLRKTEREIVAPSPTSAPQLVRRLKLSPASSLAPPTLTR